MRKEVVILRQEVTHDEGGLAAVKRRFKRRFLSSLITVRFFVLPSLLLEGGKKVRRGRGKGTALAEG